MVLTAASGACAFGVVGWAGRLGNPWCCCWCCGLGGNPGPGEWLGGCGEGCDAGVEELGGPGLPGPCCPEAEEPAHPDLFSP